MKRLSIITFCILMLAPLAPVWANAAVRIKDIADFEGVRDNVLIGYGLVVGLKGTGDSPNSVPFTRQSLVNMLERLGVNSKSVEAQLKTKNVAAVMVTGNMNALARQGSKMDITVSSLGDAKSLEGGLLLATPLLGADAETYAVAQGAIIVGGFTAEGKAGSITKNHPTVGRIANGATIERETGFELTQLGDTLRLILREPDFTTALRMQTAIDKSFGKDLAKVTDHNTVDINTTLMKGDVSPALVMQQVENLRVTPAHAARIVIDEKTGTIVMGEDVRISNVAISHANITIKVKEETIVSQPLTFNDAGETVQVDRTLIDVEEDQNPDKGRFRMLEGNGANLSDLVKGLNSLGVRPRDVISILQNIKAAGAIQAEVVVM